MRKFFEALALISRDHERTPFPWTGEEPWLDTNESFRDGINAEAELKDKDSVFFFWKKALQVRKEHNDILVYGHTLQFFDLDNDILFMFTKDMDSKKKVLPFSISVATTQISKSLIKGLLELYFPATLQNQMASRVPYSNGKEGFTHKVMMALVFIFVCFCRDS
ncbi:hypothetical protein SMKI_06G0080 [Saccharomyces mikatae IFO 1815]|uniref:Glycosyl hydrolase family 13 catalytic domain-containing protein n=1 Tax=Saccharomyces mikatae IFO 1815 TaxID=226126 RepID=A0AA35IY44_SACMI|nr:uncharacterized protein SMKI_06G0080 [Saccharomyces mikatae IFO 1815]CAI4038663.1 hypothetical protein SMKI_06G0080 [Saccharomyces mikatae IFO 1815]